MKRKGTYVERKIKQMFEDKGWIVVRSTGSFGKADLVCLKKGKALFLEAKSTRKKVIYYKSYSENTIEMFQFFVVADFGYGVLKMLKPKSKIIPSDGIYLKDFLENPGKYRNIYK